VVEDDRDVKVADVEFDDEGVAETPFRVYI